MDCVASQKTKASRLENSCDSFEFQPHAAIVSVTKGNDKTTFQVSGDLGNQVVTECRLLFQPFCFRISHALLTQVIDQSRSNKHGQEQLEKKSGCFDHFLRANVRDVRRSLSECPQRGARFIAQFSNQAKLFSSMPAIQEAETVGLLNQKFFGNCAWRQSSNHLGRNRVCFQKTL